MKEEQFRKYIRKEIIKVVKEEQKSKEKLTEGIIDDLVTKFYLWVKKSDIEVARKKLQDNPKWKALIIKQNALNKEIGRNILMDKTFFDYLISTPLKNKNKDI